MSRKRKDQNDQNQHHADVQASAAGQEQPGVFPSLPPPTHEQVAHRAHKIWLESGCQADCEQDNWLEAERQLRTER